MQTKLALIRIQIFRAIFRFLKVTGLLFFCRKKINNYLHLDGSEMGHVEEDRLTSMLSSLDEEQSSTKQNSEKPSVNLTQ